MQENSDRRHGLERRVGQEARRISSQHRQLDTFYAMVASSLQAGALPDARAAFVRFQDALEAHFSLEDGFYFPALHGLRPELDHELAELVREHELLRDGMRRVARALEHGDGAAAARLDDFVTRLAGHEGREERLVEALGAARRGKA